VTSTRTSTASGWTPPCACSSTGPTAARRELGGWLPAAEVAEARLVGAWVAAHEPPVLELDAHTDAEGLLRFVRFSLESAA
jgi:hypothetical protein